MDVRITVSGLEAEIVTSVTIANPKPRQLARELVSVPARRKGR